MKGLTARRALALGALHGPAELLPISSSAHVALVPWLARRDLPWRGPGGERLTPQEHKSLEVALHAGTAIGLAIVVRDELRPRPREALPWGPLALSALIPAAAGLALERQIERRLGTPASIAVGLLAGSAGMALAELRAPASERTRPDALDGLLLGVAQALALAPGVSRSAATRAVARRRGFGPRRARALSWQAGLPVIFGASALRAWRLVRSPPSADLRRTLLIGAGGALVSTLATGPLARRVDRGSLLPFSLYRVALALLVIRRLRENGADD